MVVRNTRHWLDTRCASFAHVARGALYFTALVSCDTICQGVPYSRTHGFPAFNKDLVDICQPVPCLSGSVLPSAAVSDFGKGGFGRRIWTQAPARSDGRGVQLNTTWVSSALSTESSIHRVRSIPFTHCDWQAGIKSKVWKLTWSQPSHSNQVRKLFWVIRYLRVSCCPRSASSINQNIANARRWFRIHEPALRYETFYSVAMPLYHIYECKVHKFRYLSPW